MEVCELFLELSSETRLSILKELKNEPLRFTKILRKVGLTSPEASRHLRRLSDVGLIEKRSDGCYNLTTFGELILLLTPSLEFIAEKSEYFLNHDASFIPMYLLNQIHALSSGEIVTGVFEVVEKIERLFNDVKEYSWYLSDDFPRFYIPKVEEKLDEDVEIRVIYPESFLKKILPELSDKIKSMTEIRMLEDVRVALNVNDTYAYIAFPGKDGKIDRNSVIIGNDSRFRKWCEELFKHYWEEAEPYQNTLTN